MKRTSTWILALALLMAASGPVTAAESGNEGSYEPVCEFTYVYERPDDTSKVRYTVSAGQNVLVVRIKRDWAEASYPGRGYFPAYKLCSR